MNLSERFIVSAAAIVVAAAASAAIARSSVRRLHRLALSTTLITVLLLLYYHFFVAEPSHGAAILILPLATVWLWWRNLNTGKPALSASALVLGQIAFALVYVAVVWLQEH